MIKSYLLKSLLISLIFFTFLTLEVFSQSTFSRVRNILNTNCINCHNGVNHTLNFTGSDDDVYDILVNSTPENQTAELKNHKLIYPGYPERSFLLRKINNGWDDYYELDPSEGDVMPPLSSGYNLSDIDKEIFRQWILNGSPKTGNVVNIQRITDFYTGLGMSKLPIPPGPPIGEGFQIRLGSFFLSPGQEIEYYKKHDLKIPDSLEVRRIDLIFNQESHHFILFKFDPGSDSDFPEGLRPVNVTNVFPSETTYLGAWTRPDSIILPQNTAYFWQPNTVLDLNYHILNYSSDSILSADAYINIYTQPVGTALEEMKSKIQIYPPAQLIIPSAQSLQSIGLNPVRTFSESVFRENSNKQWNVWMLATHTHQYGISYDVYKRNPDNTKGDKIYNGFYNTDYTFLQGFYDWEHPPVRYFDPLEPVLESRGLIHEASFLNTRNSLIPVTFGLTTEDEMMLYYIQYVETDADFTNTGKDLEDFIQLDLYPNPYKENISINYSLSNESYVKIDIYDSMGKFISNLQNGKQEIGRHSLKFNDSEKLLNKGIYVLNININGYLIRKKIIKM